MHPVPSLLNVILIASAEPLGLPPQETGGGQSSGVIVGVAIDSVRGGPLRKAAIVVEGTSQSTDTDSLGRFRLEGIRAGSIALRMSHPLLDTLRIAIVTQNRELMANDSLSFILAVPSPATLVRRKCPTAGNDAALLGTVTDAETDEPSEGAQVIVSWADYELGSKGFTRIPQLQTGRVREDGSFLVCGIPRDLSTGTMAIRGRDSTSSVNVDFRNRLVIQEYFLPSGAAAVTAAAPAARRETLTGIIVSPDGKPIAGARVAVDGDSSVAVSSATGSFSLGGIRMGTRALTVRRIGYQPAELAVAVTSRQRKPLVVEMKEPVRVLEAVRITAMRDLGLQRVGFAERQRRGMASYITPEMVERRGASRLSHLLETSIKLRSVRGPDGRQYIVAPRGNCLRYYVDGQRWRTFGDLDGGP